MDDPPSTAGSQTTMEAFEAALGEDAYSKRMPLGLTFEEIIKNKTAPVRLPPCHPSPPLPITNPPPHQPCSLSDFMDYLVYVSHSAEDLQFFLWYYHYIHRWSLLLPRQKLLSPAWGAPPSASPTRRFIPFTGGGPPPSSKFTKLLPLLDGPPSSPTDFLLTEKPLPTTTCTDFSFPPPSPPPPSSPNTKPAPDWFTVQPFRSELCGIVKHYLRENTPRQLDLSESDRASCLRAAPRTTHPSALLPAFLAVEHRLRHKHHPSFVRWTRSNANPASMIFLRVVGGLVFLLGCGLDAVLILTAPSVSPFLRLLCILLWWPGLAVFLAACKSLCLLLFLRGVRELRPWEMFPGDEEDKGEDKGGEKGDADPLRKGSLRTFGPKNDCSQERWAVMYRARPVWKKVLDETRPVMNPGLRALQERTIFKCVLWAGMGSAVLAVGSLFVPSMGVIG